MRYSLARCFKSQKCKQSQNQDLKLYNYSGHVGMEAIVQAKIMLFESILANHRKTDYYMSL